jgi:hypothetical protein
MKTILRFQSQLLNRRGYKPSRRVRVAFRPAPRLVLRMTVTTPAPPMFEFQPINDS